MKTLDDVIAWAKSKNCKPRRQGGNCEHSACVENDKAIAFLESGAAFEGTDAAGKKVKGWLIRKP